MTLHRLLVVDINVLSTALLYDNLKQVWAIVFEKRATREMVYLASGGPCYIKSKSRYLSMLSVPFRNSRGQQVSLWLMIHLKTVNRSSFLTFQATRLSKQPIVSNLSYLTSEIYVKSRN